MLECGVEAEFIPGLIRHTSLNKWGSLDKLKAEVQRVAAKLDHTRSKAEPELAIEIVEDSPREPLLQIRKLSELVNMPPPRWRIDGLVEEGGCGFIAAPPKHYKSWIMLDMAISLSLGQPVLGYARSHQAPCLIIEAEDSLSRVWSRVQTILQCRFPNNDPRGYITCKSGVLELNPPDGEIPLYIAGRPTQGLSPELAEEIGETIESMGIGLVCYDTLSMLTTESINDSQAMYGQILQPIKAVAQATGCAQLIVHHTRKASKDMPSTGGAALAGSVALHAWSDNSLYISRQAESLSIQVETKSGSQDLVVTGLDTPGEWQPEVVQSL
jgi:RecA-family ATPase